MYREINKLVLYRVDLPEDSSAPLSILARLSQLFRTKYEVSETDPSAAAWFLQQNIRSANSIAKSILDISTTYGFNDNLWQNYLTYYILTNENSFSLTCERAGATEGGSVNDFAKQDFKVFKRLFDFDFSEIEKDLDISCFSALCNYHAIPKRTTMYNKNVSTLVREVSGKIAAAKDESEFFDIVTAFYRDHGVGTFGFNRAFRIAGSGETMQLSAINNIDDGKLSDIVGYEFQKKQLTDNTEAFIAGRSANNVLLYGDSGTGKSTSVKALLNDYFDSSLRMIEIYKHQFHDLSAVISQIKNRNYRFIIYIDDLSFEENETEYKFLKAVIEGGVETRPENVLIYATSNRRHLVRETWKDRADTEHDGDIHRSDTVEEKLSLASRFGVSINFSQPGRALYHEIVKTLAAKQPEIALSDDELFRQADTWDIRHGGMSGRTAEQFIKYLAGKKK